jgi:hypothetical protein
MQTSSNKRTFSPTSKVTKMFVISNGTEIGTDASTPGDAARVQKPALCVPMLIASKIALGVIRSHSGVYPKRWWS